MIKGETADISIFRFSWFQPVWYYNPLVSFPNNKMEPGLFLDLADNTGDGFSYELLPAFSFKDILQRRNPVTLVRCVVRPRVMTSTDAPVCENQQMVLNFTIATASRSLGQRRILLHLRH